MAEEYKYVKFTKEKLTDFLETFGAMTLISCFDDNEGLEAIIEIVNGESNNLMRLKNDDEAYYHARLLALKAVMHDATASLVEDLFSRAE